MSPFFLLGKELSGPERSILPVNAVESRGFRRI